MIVYQYPEPSPPIVCPYLPDQTLVYDYFYASSLDARELSWFLSRGWRKFGIYFFRPSCPGCLACTPLRIRVHDFLPSRSQQRVLRLGKGIRTHFGPIRYEEELFRLYCAHSKARFNQECTFEDFISHLHTPSCPSILSRYELDGKLLAAGYLDHCAEGLSSVYFVFDPEFSKQSLGVLSVLREIEYARALGLKYYYLGYYVPGCSRMAYKAAYYPQERFSWPDNIWVDVQTSRFSRPFPGKIHSFKGWTGIE